MRISLLALVLLLPLLLLVPTMAATEEQAATAQEADYSTPHKRAFACFENDEITFEGDPADCDAACNECHEGENVMAGDTTASFTLVYTLVFEEPVSSLSTADLTISGGALVEGSLAKLDESTWTLEVSPTGSITDVTVALNNGKNAAITKKLVVEKVVEGQEENPELVWTDMFYPGLYPNASIAEVSSSNTPEQNWEALPALHQVCKECHPTQSAAVHNHPMFVNMAIDFGTGSSEELGLLLCVTCHDPHSNKVALARIENTGSQLCQYCHGK